MVRRFTAASNCSYDRYFRASAIANISLRVVKILEKVLTPVLVVAAALIDTAGHVLLQKRRLGGMHGGLWEFPGGKIDAGESPETALARELHEELGIAVDPSALLPLTFASDRALPPEPREPYVILLYTCRCWQGDPRCLDGEAIDWFAPVALAALAAQPGAMPPLDVPLAQALLGVI